MIGRKTPPEPKLVDSGPRSFDDFELRLGDIMRGERATLGKSLLDVQRELRIKASYIAAIENCDPSAFDTPGFIAGYVRSYSRYLGMDPDETFAKFCAESGFATAHGMSDRASNIKKTEKPSRIGKDPFTEPAMPFAPVGESVLSQIEPRAIGSTLVLLALVSGIGYGAWSVLQEVQRVQVAPVDQTPVVLSDLDPIDAASASTQNEEIESVDVAGVFDPPRTDALDRLYRPQALDVPVLVARDAPISTLDPSTVGAYAHRVHRDETEIRQQVDLANALPTEDPSQTTPKVLEDAAPGVVLVAVRPAWVRVRAADGSVIYEGIMNAGDTYDVPNTHDAATLRVGESGAVYFAVNGQTYGPVGETGSVTSNVALSVGHLTQNYALAEPETDSDLERVVAQLNTSVIQPPSK
jgi:hypothetical protein